MIGEILQQKQTKIKRYGNILQQQKKKQRKYTATTETKEAEIIKKKNNSDLKIVVGMFL
jgi:ribosomal protein S8E